MEPTTTHSVHRGPAWKQGGNSAPASASDPLAFFDLIMSTAQKMSAQGGERNDPLAAMAPQDAPNQQSASSANDSPHWQNDRHHDNRNEDTLPDRRLAESASPATDSESPAEDHDAAAVADFAERPGSEDEEQATPDEAALATAGAAGQQSKLLGAPDPLKPAEEPVVVGTETEATDPAIAKHGGSDRLAAEAAPSDADAPWDTSVPATEEKPDDATDRQAVADLEAQIDAKAKKTGSDEKPEQAVQGTGADEAPQEGGGDASPDVKTTRDLDRPASNDAEAEAKTSQPESDPNSGDKDSRESRHEGEASAAVVRSKSNKPKPTIAEAAQTAADSPPQTSESASAQNKSDAVAAAATATASAPQAASSRGGATSNDQGTTGITSLLQRGLQRGTLQKATEGKPTAGLDTKQQVRLVNRVARAVETTPPGQAIRIRLNPSELGALKVEIKIESGNLTARIEAENPATRQVLLENLPQLKERLAESNIQVQQFEVDLMGQESPHDRETSQFPDGTGRRDEGRSSGERGSARSGEEDADRETARRRTVNKEAEQESRNLNVTV